MGTLRVDRFVPDSHPSWRTANNGSCTAFVYFSLVRVLPRESKADRSWHNSVYIERGTFIHWGKRRGWLQRVAPFFPPSSSFALLFKCSPNLPPFSRQYTEHCSWMFARGMQPRGGDAGRVAVLHVYLGSSPASGQHNSRIPCKSWKRPDTD